MRGGVWKEQEPQADESGVTAQESEPEISADNEAEILLEETDDAASSAVEIDRNTERKSETETDSEVEMEKVTDIETETVEEKTETEEQATDETALAASDEDIASGMYENITWVIDKDGKLTVTGTGEFLNEINYNRAPWYSDRSSITSVKVICDGITDLSYMFSGCSNLVNIDLSSFNTENVKSMMNMFSGCSSLINVDLSSFSTGSLLDMEWMFSGCSSLISVDLSSFNTRNVKYTHGMFDGCSSLVSVDLSNFNTENVINMQWMFDGCNSLTSVDLNSFDTGNVTDMKGMFRECNKLTELDLSSFNTEKVQDIEGIFYGCSKLTSIDMSNFDFSKVTTNVENMFANCNNLTTIQTPKNIAVKIALPKGGWYYDGKKVTSLPQNLNYSVEVKKGKDTGPSVGGEGSVQKLLKAVQNVPYENILQNGNAEATSYRISSGALPEGINLSADGVIYGITKESGKYTFTVTMTVNGADTSTQRTLTLQVLKSTDKVVDAIDEPGYEIIQPIPDIIIEQGVTDQLFISNGPFEEFRNAYIDGNLLTRDVDYTAESGSTRITIKAETLDRLGKGKHTLGVEFRTKDNTLKRIAQNFDVKDKKSGGSSSGSHGSSSGSDSSSEGASASVGTQTAKPKVTVTAANVTESVMDDTEYYSVFLPSDNAILRLSFFNKVYGNNATILAYLDNGIGYNLNMNAFLAAGKDLNLSTKETELNGFAQGFKTIWLSVAEKAQLNYDLGINLMAGAEYAGHPVYVFIYDDAAGTFAPHTETAVTEYGNVGFHTRRLTDFIIMIAQ